MRLERDGQARIVGELGLGLPRRLLRASKHLEAAPGCCLGDESGRRQISPVQLLVWLLPRIRLYRLEVLLLGSYFLGHVAGPYSAVVPESQVRVES